MAPVFHFIQSVLGDQRLIISKLKFVKNIFELCFFQCWQWAAPGFETFQA